MYIKFLDVVINPQTLHIQPVAVVNYDTSQFLKHAIIPCVYIENKVFYELNDEEIDTMASKLVSKVLSMARKNCQEIHIDCDWSKNTQKKYFYFIEKLKAISQRNISATIRLHQIKYARQTGIPPVNDGVLMCYNMGVIQDVKEKNSIYRSSVLKKYTKNVAAYPVKLTIALPIYAWNVVFRGDKFLYIYNNEISFAENIYFEKENENIYRCVRSTNLGNKPLLKGDRVRYETASVAELKEAVQLFANTLEKPNFIFYHLNTQNLQTYEVFFDDCFAN
ncbi:MAG: hypothetical protein ACKVOU_03400 [Cytophagales bacterium]